MQVKDPTGAGGTTPHPSNFLHQRIPELSRIADIEVLNLFYKDSSDLNPDDWKALAITIENNYTAFDGFVILHGTDTMAYTASALSFSLKHLDKPVILTGSQIPLAVIRSDASRNLINAIEVATMPLPEVAICFNDHIYRGNRCTKSSVGDFDAFSSPNYPALADIGLNITMNTRYVPASKSFYISPEFDEKIYLIRLFPGMNPAFLENLTDLDLRAIVIEAYGCGNFPISGRYSLLPFFSRCVDGDIILVINSQAPQDSIDLDKYESGRKAKDLGVISAEDMTTEASVTKMMHLLAIYDDPQTIKQHYGQPIAGEISVKKAIERSLK